MDTNTSDNPTPFNPQDSILPGEPIEAFVPVPVRPQRAAGDFRRFKLLATSAAIAALTATGGLAVMASIAAMPAAATTERAAAAPQTTTSGAVRGVNAAQPPQRGAGGSGHASTGGS
jgi:hypothetical protein